MAERRRANAYQTYVTDALQIIAENTAKIGGGKYLKGRYIDLITPHKAPVKDTRTGEEIAADIIRKIAREGG